MAETLISMGCIFVAIFAFIVGGVIGHNQAMDEAHSLGLAKQCLGQTGYHFTCEAPE